MTISGIAILRLLLVLFCLIAACLWAKLVTWGHKTPIDQVQVKPLPQWRYRLLKLGSAIWVRGLLVAIGVWKLDIHGERDPNTRVLVANHITLVDGIVLQVLETPMFVAKAETSAYPLFGTFLRAVQTIFVDRTSREARSRTLESIKYRTTAPGFPPLCIFPEGTIGNGSSLCKFKPGAFVPGIPVQPIALKINCHHFDYHCTLVGRLLVVCSMRTKSCTFNRMVLVIL